MPVRLLNSSVLKWPSRIEVLESFRVWARARALPGVKRIGCIGSCAGDTWGVGSDLDIVIVVDAETAPFEQRAAQWDTTDLPVPCDVMVFTEEELVQNPSIKFREELEKKSIWIWRREDASEDIGAAQQEFRALIENCRSRSLWFMKSDLPIDIMGPYADAMLDHIAQQSPRSDWLTVRKLRRWRSRNIK